MGEGGGWTGVTPKIVNIHSLVKNYKSNLKCIFFLETELATYFVLYLHYLESLDRQVAHLGLCYFNSFISLFYKQ